MEISFADGKITLEADRGIAVVTFRNPDKRNALNQAMWSALPRIFEMIAADRDILVTILTGADDHFTAGADIAEFEDAFASRKSTAESYHAIDKGIAVIAASPKPVIAAIEGFCVGGGVALAVACDIRFCGSRTRFAITPAKIGFIYPISATRLLVDAIGRSRASQLLFTGRPFDAAAASHMGLVGEVVPTGQAFASAWQEALNIAEVSQFTVRASKSVILGVTGERPPPEVDMLLLDTVEGPDFLEGSAAFVAKRPARFTYR